MKSTPINCLLAESGEISLEYRRQLLAIKFYLKIRSDNNNPLNAILDSLSDMYQARIGYWRVRDPPYLIEAKIVADHVITNLYRTDVNPCFQIEVSDQVDRIRTVFSAASKNGIYSNQCFLNEFADKCMSYTWVFTDGSLNPIDQSVGCAVHIPDIKYNFSTRLLDHTQICSAEILAINKAIVVCIEKELTKCIIFSDSERN